MHADDVLSLGLGVRPPWKLVGQRLDTDTRPSLAISPAIS